MSWLTVIFGASPRSSWTKRPEHKTAFRLRAIFARSSYPKVFKK